MRSPFFSIYVPVYNAENYLRKCLDSIFSQTFKDFELFLNDDLSSDNSYSICQEYANKYHNVFLSQGEKRGTYAEAQNGFVEHAKGEFLIFIDNDDYIAPNHLENIYNHLMISNADCALVSYKVVDESGSDLDWYTPRLNDGAILGSEEIRRELLTTLNVEGFRWNKICRRRVIIDNNIVLEKDFPADIPFSYKVLSTINDCVMVAEPTYYYRQRATSEVAQKSVASSAGMVNAHRKIAELSMNNGMDKEATYFKVYRSIHDLFNAWKYRSEYEKNEWSTFLRDYCWKNTLGMSVYKALRILNQYPDFKDGHLKFAIKTIIVRWAYR